MRAGNYYEKGEWLMADGQWEEMGSTNIPGYFIGHWP
jgi:hypothetical protein